MGVSQRIRTEIGINKTINVELEQDFNYLEILSLKIQQEEVYSKSCSQYGVVVGRVTANNGYGVPNAKVSVFIPISEEDKLNPTIFSIYPYTTPTDKNEDGFRYNLLPYEKSHTNHVPVGTLPSRFDSLTDRTAIEIYDKYYKFTVKTNENGDYMIMGAPLGVQIIFMDLDLSDIGEFSLSPQDLIRMGRATESQVSGRQFRVSNDLDTLPQIVSLTKSVDISPLWGDPEICQIAINRVDFDLRDDANIDIQPTAVFIGSLISSIDSKSQKIKCKPHRELGNNCNLVAGPGQMLAIRQTIFKDNNGWPILEQYHFDGGDDIIDGDGTWMVDLPMNLDYVITNEFGERVFSNDPKIGIPTKGKYRFKAKWKQSDDLGRPVVRANYLIPNVREYGWTNSTSDPLNSGAGSPDYEMFIKSYAFSLDWADYGQTGSTSQRGIIRSFIDCEDRFYPFDYNKVYTVSNFIDLYHKGVNRERFIGIKQITDVACDSTNYKFPTNDGVRNADILFSFFSFFIQILTYIFLPVLVLFHIIAFIFPVLRALFTFVYTVLAWIVYGICVVVDVLVWWKSLGCKKPKNPKEVWDQIGNPFKKITLPAITYPECEICTCVEESLDINNNVTAQSQQQINEDQGVTCLIPATNSASFSNISDSQYCEDDPIIGGSSNTRACEWITSEDLHCTDSYGPTRAQLLAGSSAKAYYKRMPANTLGNCAANPLWEHSQDLTLSERMNLFNTKGKYFENLQGNYFGGTSKGWNQIKVQVRPDLSANQNKYHYDNVFMMVVNEGCGESYTAGSLVTFTDLKKSGDFNILSGKTVNYLDIDGNEATLKSITGTPINLSSVQYNYADPFNPNNMLTQTYVVDQTSGVTKSIRPNSAGQIQTFTYFSPNNGGLPNNFYVNLPTLRQGLGRDATFNVTVAGGIVTQVILINAGSGYDSGDSIFIDGSLIGGVRGSDDIEIIIGNVTPQLYDDVIVQKFPTDVEYFQVITAMTYGSFASLNPVTSSGQYNDYGSRNEYLSLKYRFLENFQTTFYDIAYLIDSPVGFSRCSYPYPVVAYNSDETYRPIYGISDQKLQYVVFLMRGVDPHSARQTTEIDISRLLGRDYGFYKITGEYKLNIPIQPGLVLPRHDEILNNTSLSVGRPIFFDSRIYQTSAEFSGFTSTTIANYSSLDAKTVQNRFQVDGNSYSILDYGKIGFSNGYVCAHPNNNQFSTNSYEQGYMTIGCDNNRYPTQYDAGAYAQNNTSVWLNLSGDKCHRGYYPYEYVEGGSYFFLGKRRKVKINQCVTYTFLGVTLQTACPPTQDVIEPDQYVYFSPAYSTATTINFIANSQKIVMRTDRLPTSSKRTDTYGNNTFLFQQNNSFAIQVLSDEGLVSSNYNFPNPPSVNEDFAEDAGSQFEESVMNTFTCQGLVPLKCYNGSGLSFGVLPQPNDCYSNPSIVRSGCYVFVDQAIFRLGKDIKALAEWKTRLRVNLAACRGIFSHTFNNNWINGTLFMFPFKNLRKYSPPNGGPSGNQPSNRFCNEVVMLHPETNNFYYRSTPYSGKKFIGRVGPSYGRNSLQIMYPTTIMDLGPRDDFAYELTLNPNYYGYNMTNLRQTTFQDVSNILNLFVISRQISSSFWGRLFSAGDASIGTFFSRNKRRIDGDYAQAISINSELGVDEFDFEYYDYSTGATTNTNINSFFVGDQTIGIFFSSNTQTRDFVSPRRIIRNDVISPGVYDSLPMFSQFVPMYKWQLRYPNNSNSIFGNQYNDWRTSSSDISQNYRYQSMDRTDRTFNYFMGETNLPLVQTGYLFNLTNPSPGTFTFAPYLGGTFVNPGSPTLGRYTTGAPFFFYFGLIRGNNSLDKFNSKYLGVENI